MKAVLEGEALRREKEREREPLNIIVYGSLYPSKVLQMKVNTIIGRFRVVALFFQNGAHVSEDWSLSL